MSFHRLSGVLHCTLAFLWDWTRLPWVRLKATRSWISESCATFVIFIQICLSFALVFIARMSQYSRHGKLSWLCLVCVLVVRLRKGCDPLSLLWVTNHLPFVLRMSPLTTDSIHHQLHPIRYRSLWLPQLTHCHVSFYRVIPTVWCESLLKVVALIC